MLVFHAADFGGSIPACAGEPPIGAPRQPDSGVYPRVCGGTWRVRTLGRGFAGLSPRVRGNPRRDPLLARR